MSNDQEDVFDCNVDGPALTAVGHALGLHTGDEDPSPSDSDSGSGSDEGGGGGGEALSNNGKKNEKKSRPSRPSAGSGGPESAELETEGAMTTSDLVWW